VTATADARFLQPHRILCVEADGSNLEPYDLLVFHPERAPLPNAKLCRRAYFMELAIGRLQERLSVHESFDGDETGIQCSPWPQRSGFGNAHAKVVTVHIQGLAHQREIRMDTAIRKAKDQAREWQQE
jgi:hypothetical protein